jgi:hypothetical protein
MANTKRVGRKPRTSSKKSRKGTPKKAINAASVREKLANIVRTKAPKVVTAVMEEVEKKANIPAMKYLFEMGGIFPGESQGKADQPEENAGEMSAEPLAKILLHELGLPEKIEVDEDGEIKQNTEEQDEAALTVE